MKKLIFIFLFCLWFVEANSQAFRPRYENRIVAGTNTYTLTISPTPSLQDGLTYSVYFSNANTGAATFNLSGTGAKALVDSDGNPLTSGFISSGSTRDLRYDLSSNKWRVLGGGGETVAGVYVAIDSPRLKTTSTSGYVWTATDNLGNGDWAAASASGGGFTVSASQPVSGTVTWLDSGNPYAGFYPEKVYTNSEWKETNRYYDPVGNIFSIGKPLLVAVWGQSNTATSFNLNYIGSKNTAYFTTSSTSINTTTLTRGTSLTITIGTGKSWQVGQYTNIVSRGTPTEFIIGKVTAYNSSTGSFTVLVLTTPVSGGALTDWDITVAMVNDITTDNRITLWNADANQWEVPDYMTQLPSGTGTANNWSWNLNLGENNIQAFAKKIIEKTGRAVRIVQWREGGTTLAYWEKDALAGGFPGWVALNASIIESGLPTIDVVIGNQGESGLGGGGYTSSYSTYMDALYKAVIPAFRTAVWGSEQTVFIMLSTANKKETFPVSVSLDESEFAIRSLNEGRNRNAWGQGSPVKQIRQTTAGQGGTTSTTSINLSSVSSPFSLVVPNSFGYNPDNKIWIVSRANNHDRIRARYVSGTGTLSLLPLEVWGSGTHTDWDVLPDDYLHLTSTDHVASGEGAAESFLNIGSKNYKPRTAQWVDDYDGTLDSASYSYAHSKMTRFTFGTIPGNKIGPMVSWNFSAQGTPPTAKIEANSSGAAIDMVYYASAGTALVSSDEVYRINYSGAVIKKPLYFGMPAFSNPINDSRIEKLSGPIMFYHAGWTGGQVSQHQFSLGNSSVVFKILENGGSGAEYAQFDIPLKLGTAGNGLQIKGGTNATIGTATANGSTEVTVSTTKVTANSVILIMCQSGCGATSGPYYISARTPGTSFGFKSTAGDTGTVGWWILEKN